MARMLAIVTFYHFAIAFPVIARQQSFGHTYFLTSYLRVPRTAKRSPFSRNLLPLPRTPKQSCRAGATMMPPHCVSLGVMNAEPTKKVRLHSISRCNRGSRSMFSFLLYFCSSGFLPLGGIILFVYTSASIGQIWRPVQACEAGTVLCDNFEPLPFPRVWKEIIKSLYDEKECNASSASSHVCILKY